ncbi:MAG: transposase [Patescibacteria group bacterium]
MQRKEVFAQGEYYHIYNRGVDKRKIFLDDFDYSRFMRMMYVCNSNQAVIFKDIADIPYQEIIRGDRLVDLGAYCLMPNHFHFLIKERAEGGISMFMKKLFTGYSMFFNKKYNRSGALFQGRFRAEHAFDDKYLNYLFSYIHLNPIRKSIPEGKIDELKLVLEMFDYSSYKDYCKKEREESCIINKEEFPDYFQSAIDFRDFINDWLVYEEYYTTN